MSFYNEEKVLDVIDKVSKCVVNISTVRLVQNIFYQAVPVSGMGSGTIFDADKGLIMTNHHVVGGAQKINVTLWNNEVIEGTIAGSCVGRDIALVRVNAKNLQFAELGDSDKLRVGQRVFAIGNPFGLTGGPTVTSGVISALNRTIESDRGLIENLVQTDAAINPGNSGGPLVDLDGKIVAISTAIIPFAQGIGFAIPINSAKACTTDIITEGTGQRPWLGVVGLTLTSEIARYYGFPVGHGVLVTRVAEGSPADYAGMAEGDIVLEVDNVETRSIEDLVREIRKRRVGDVVRVFALRNSREHFFELKLRSMT
ncbi:MAG: trypsin-like peptidase domain-containing protein [Candidatus Bathyarchaeota archaeon]|nr:trypsin-like peptidase domain-containing protein [Candidatus Bathyarchaeota archaeon]